MREFCRDAALAFYQYHLARGAPFDASRASRVSHASRFVAVTRCSFSDVLTARGSVYL